MEEMSLVLAALLLGAFFGVTVALACLLLGQSGWVALQWYAVAGSLGLVGGAVLMNLGKLRALFATPRSCKPTADADPALTRLASVALPDERTTGAIPHDNGLAK